MKRSPIPEFEIEKFFRYVKATDSCWEWGKTIQSNGYGFFCVNKKYYYAHRVSFFIFNGYLTEGLNVDHTCMNRKCVNPEHLREVSKQISVIENSNSLAAVNSRKTACPRGHPYSRVTSYGRRVCKACCLIRYHLNRDKINEKVRNTRKLKRNSIITE